MVAFLQLTRGALWALNNRWAQCFHAGSPPQPSMQLVACTTPYCANRSLPWGLYILDLDCSRLCLNAFFRLHWLHKFQIYEVIIPNVFEYQWHWLKVHGPMPIQIFLILFPPLCCLGRVLTLVSDIPASWWSWSSGRHNQRSMTSSTITSLCGGGWH